MAGPRKPLVTAPQYLGVDPMAAGGFFYDRALGESRDARVKRQRDIEDADLTDRMLHPVAGSNDNPANALAATRFNRAQQDAAMGPTGYNRQWVPYFEAQNVQADANPSMNFRTNYGGLADMMSTESSGDQPGQAVMSVRKGGQAPSMRALSKVAGY